jgi:signal transduction histidine kinase/CHASE3 domain sensor protein/CheY-like chemotaxis protein
MPRQSGSLIAFITVPLILLMLGTALFAYHSAKDLEASRSLVNMTNQVLGETQELLILAQSAETAQRGFLLTGNEDYLKPYHSAEVEIPHTVEALRGLLYAAPGQQARLESLNGYLQLKLRELNDTIDTRRVKGFKAAQAIVMDNSGESAMESIRGLVNDMTIAERTLLEQRLIQSRAAEHQAFLITGALFLGLTILSFGGGYMFLRSFERLAQTENELEVKARLLQTTLDTIDEGIGAFDGSARLVASNRRFFEVLGLNPVQAATVTTLDDVVAIDRELDGTFPAITALPASDTRAASGLFERGDGRTLDVAKSLMPTGGTVFTARDITDSVKAETALRQAQKMETVGQLTGGVAHDFNNLLQIIMANLDLALRHVTDPTVQKRLKDALVGAERGSKLTRQLLAFARRQPLKPEPVNLGKLVRELTELLRRTLGESIEIEETSAAGMWTAMVDRSQLENAIVNLAINARDAMPEGGRLTIETGNAYLDDDYARLHDQVRAGQYVMLAVTDTGIGMSKDTISRAFDPFFSTKPEGRGTGLGLSMVYGFARQSGGHAKIYSEPGVGTTVKLYIPRSMQAEKTVVKTASDTMTGRGEIILVVEDESNVRSAVIAILQDLDYRTLEAANGAAALEILQSDAQIDLMFTDVVMPGEIQGRKLAQEALKLRPNLCIVFTSGYTENSIIHHGRLDDGVHLLSKPYRKEDLARKMRSVLNDCMTKAGIAATATATATPIAEPVIPKAEPTPMLKRGEEPASFDGKRIMFVEDDPLVQMATIDMLEAFGFEVVSSSDFGDSLLALHKKQPDALLVDVNLGGGDGRQLAIEARKLFPDLKVIFATGRDPGDLQSLVPGSLLLNKPYGMPELQMLFTTLFNG